MSLEELFADEAFWQAVKSEPEHPPDTTAVELPALVQSIYVPIPTIRLCNMVCTTRIGCSIEKLSDCQKKLENASCPGNFPALFVQLRDPDMTVSLHSTGSLVSRGHFCYEKQVEGIRRFVDTLAEIGYAAQHNDIHVQNIVCAFGVGHRVHIDKILRHHHHRLFCRKSDNFACIDYRIHVAGHDITFRIFADGNIICQAGKSMDEVEEAARKMIPILFLFRNLPTPVDPKSLIDHFS